MVLNFSVLVVYWAIYTTRTLHLFNTGGQKITWDILDLLFIYLFMGVNREACGATQIVLHLIFLVCNIPYWILQLYL